MKFCIYLTSAFFFFSNSWGQNLVPNHSFEESTGCPASQGNLFVTYWYNPNNQTPDFFSPCGLEKWYSAPDNSENFGYQEAASGSNYVGIRAWDDEWGPDIREYVGVELTSQLEACKLYYVSFKVSLAEGPKTKWAIDDLGIYFSASPIGLPSGIITNVTPQIRNPEGSFLTETKNWTTIEGYILAQGNEKYICIGNFETYNNTSRIDISPSKYNGTAYYYIDDVTVTKVDGTPPFPDIVSCNDVNNYYTPFFSSDSIKWSVNSGETFISTQKSILLEVEGVYSVEAFQKTCGIKDTFNVKFENCNSILIMPNILTVNKDELNESFVPVALNNVEVTEIVIYNRWGDIIFKADGFQQAWSPARENDSVYFYLIQYTDKLNRKNNLRGWVQVIR